MGLRNNAISRAIILSEALENRVLLSTAVPMTTTYASAPAALPARQMEYLDRGVVAINKGFGSVYVSWRLLGTDSSGVAFNVYRSTNGQSAVKLNATPITASTNYSDSGVDTTKPNSWFVRPVVGGVEGAASKSFTLGANSEALPYVPIRLRDGNAHFAQMGFGDLDGDGEYEYIVKWSTAGGHDPGSTHTPSLSTVYIDAYKLDGTFMWRVNLGWNLEIGDDYTPMLVYDLNGDGRAEVITKTAEGTTDGTGVTIGDTNADGKTDYRDPTTGRVLAGPEFMSIFDGLSGREVARTNWISRGNVSDWGDGYGNRVSRHLLGIAYLDGVRPSIVECRGVYALQKVETWNYRDGALTQLWSWTNNGIGIGGHQSIRLGDVDGDGKDEIIKGGFVLDDNGSVLYDTGLGHGDFLNVSVLDPSLSGMQIFTMHEAGGVNAVEMHDAATGTLYWGKTINSDPARSPAAQIDPRYPGLQCWSGGSNNLYDAKGNLITANGPSAGGYWTSILWDADLQRELISEHSNGENLMKWDYLNSTMVATDLAPTGAGAVRIGFVADVLGDWREEMVAVYPDEIRVYSTSVAASTRTFTFMHDPLYRLNSGQWAQRNAATALPSFYFGSGMSAPAAPNIYTPSATDSTVYPAETASFGDGAVIETTNTGFNGTAYINYPLTGGFVQFNNVDGASGGASTLKFRYALGAATSRTGQLTVNGVVQNITFPVTGAWTNWALLTVDVTLNAGTTNTIRIQSTGQDLANIDELRVITPSAAVPVAPTSLTATRVGTGNQVNLAWSATSGATRYNIRRSFQPSGRFEMIAVGTTGTSFSDTTAPFGTTYYYSVTALNEHGESAPSAEASVTLPMISPWTRQDIGTLGIPGRATVLNDQYTIAGNGPLNTSDGSTLLYQNLTGDFTITAHVDSTDGSTSGSGGLSARKSLSSTAAFVDLVASNDGRNHIFLNYRGSDGGGKTYKVSTGAAPVWLRLKRVGNVFTGFFSTDAVTWTQVGAVTITMPAAIPVGLCGTGGSNVYTTSAFSNVNVAAQNVVLTGTTGNDIYYLVRSGSTVQLFSSDPPAGSPVNSWPASELNSMTINAGNGNDTFIIDYAGGDPTPLGAITFNGGANNDTLSIIGTSSADNVNFNAGSVDFGTKTITDANTESRVFDGKLGLDNLSNIGGPEVQIKATQSFNTLNLDNGQLSVKPGSGAVIGTRSLSITGGGKLNLHDNDLYVDYTGGSSPYSNIFNMILSGLTLLGGSGNGITSTEVDNQTISGAILGVVDNGSVGGEFTTLGGVSVPANSILIKYTWFGDSNLDGAVDGSDYALIDTGFTSGNTLNGWLYGDYDYGDIVDGSDYALIDTGFISQNGLVL